MKLTNYTDFQVQGFQPTDFLTILSLDNSNSYELEYNSHHIKQGIDNYKSSSVLATSLEPMGYELGGAGRVEV